MLFEFIGRGWAMGIINKIKDKYHDNMVTRTYYNSISIINVERYLQNERNKRILGEEIAKLPDYEYAEKIHEYLKLHEIDASENTELRRIGRINDGGYIMVSPFSKTHIAYSIGIYHDVSWDLDMAKEGYQVFQYDHTINGLPINNDRFCWKKVGLSDKNDPANKLQALDTMIKENGHDDKNGLLLKMDVEGCEWKVLESLSKECLSKFDQIVMEMHGFMNYSNRELILGVLKKMSEVFACVHIHANNFGPVDYCGDYMIPQLLEVTYINRARHMMHECNKILPIAIDQPCNDALPDIILGRWT